MALATLTNFGANFGVSLLLPSVQEALGPAGGWVQRALAACLQSPLLPPLLRRPACCCSPLAPPPNRRPTPYSPSSPSHLSAPFSPCLSPLLTLLFSTRSRLLCVCGHRRGVGGHHLLHRPGDQGESARRGELRSLPLLLLCRAGAFASTASHPFTPPPLLPNVPLPASHINSTALLSLNRCRARRWRRSRLCGLWTTRPSGTGSKRAGSGWPPQPREAAEFWLTEWICRLPSGRAEHVRLSAF